MDRIPASLCGHRIDPVHPAHGGGLRCDPAGLGIRLPQVHLKRLFGATFALSSVLTPFFLGTVAGSVASGRVPLGNAAGDPITSWLNPTSLFAGTFAVVLCAYLAAVYLTADATRRGDAHLAGQFRSRALASGIGAGAIALAGIAVLRADAPRLFAGLLERALPLIPVSALAGIATLALVWTRRFVAARGAAALAVTTLLWGWAAGQYPYMLQGIITIEQAAAPRATQEALVVTLGIGAVLIAPALLWLFVLFQRGESESGGAQSGPGQVCSVIPSVRLLAKPGPRHRSVRGVPSVIGMDPRCARPR